VHVGRPAEVVRAHSYHLTDIALPLASRHVEGAVLLREPAKPRTGQVDPLAVLAVVGVLRGVARQGPGTGVEDRSASGRPAYDRGEHRERALGERHAAVGNRRKRLARRGVTQPVT
jgi:hypothetical protein